MKKEYRLCKNKDFKDVLDKKNSVACGEFVIYFKKNDLLHARIGISVSSKIGNSVIRHRVKRQISEMFKEIYNFIHNEDVVVIVKNKFLNNTFVENKEKLNKLLKKMERGDKK